MIPADGDCLLGVLPVVYRIWASLWLGSSSRVGSGVAASFSILVLVTGYLRLKHGFSTALDIEEVLSGIGREEGISCMLWLLMSSSLSILSIGLFWIVLLSRSRVA